MGRVLETECRCLCSASPLSTGSQNVLRAGRTLSVTEDKGQPYHRQRHLAANKTKAPQKNETTNEGCFVILFPNPSLACRVPPPSPSSSPPPPTPHWARRVHVVPTSESRGAEGAGSLYLPHQVQQTNLRLSLPRELGHGDGVWPVSALAIFLQRD